MSLRSPSCARSSSWSSPLGSARTSAAARNTSLVVVLASLVGLAIIVTDFNDRGPLPGVTRFGAIAALSYCVFRLDLLGTNFQALTARRGTLGTIALAALFIVAQVGQNLFAAQYGLLMGGVVAGALLFAASPLQRAIEGRSRARGAQAAPLLDERDDVARREDVYRKALRLALRDRRVTREEETHLHELAQELSIPGARAHQLLSEIERESEERAR